jgi:hypothetical protein
MQLSQPGSEPSDRSLEISRVRAKVVKAAASVDMSIRVASELIHFGRKLQLMRDMFAIFLIGPSAELEQQRLHSHGGMGGKPAMFAKVQATKSLRKLKTRDMEKAHVICRKLHKFKLSSVKSHELTCAESCSIWICRNFHLHVMSCNFLYLRSFASKPRER